MFDYHQERREFPRIEVQINIDVRTTYIYTTASALNISRYGLFIRTPHPLPEGMEVDLVMHFPKHEEPFRFKGIVKWSRTTPLGLTPPGMGVQLLNPDDAQIDQLLEQIKITPKNF